MSKFLNILRLILFIWKSLEQEQSNAIYQKVLAATSYRTQNKIASKTIFLQTILVQFVCWKMTKIQLGIEKWEFFPRIKVDRCHLLKNWQAIIKNQI